MRDVDDARRRDPRDVRLAGLAVGQRREHGVDRLLEAEQKARHLDIGDRDRSAVADLVVKQRDHRAARGEHVAVPGADEARARSVEVGPDEDPLLDRLRHAHDVHRLDGLVGRDADDRLHRQPALTDRPDDVLGARDVRLHRLVGEVLAGGHLLERRRVEHDVRVAQHGADARVVAHVADRKAQQPLVVVVDDLVRRGLQPLVGQSHRVLLGLVAREDGDLLRCPEGAGQQAADEDASERTRAARDHDALAGQHGSVALLSCS